MRSRNATPARVRPDTFLLKDFRCGQRQQTAGENSRKSTCECDCFFFSRFCEKIKKQIAFLIWVWCVVTWFRYVCVSLGITNITFPAQKERLAGVSQNQLRQDVASFRRPAGHQQVDLAADPFEAPIEYAIVQVRSSDINQQHQHYTTCDSSPPSPRPNPSDR